MNAFAETLENMIFQGVISFIAKYLAKLKAMELQESIKN
jgi:hypothetical protein